jgi:hypothetical protein
MVALDISYKKWLAVIFCLIGVLVHVANSKTLGFVYFNYSYLFLNEDVVRDQYGLIKFGSIGVGVRSYKTAMHFEIGYSQDLNLLKAFEIFIKEYITYSLYKQIRTYAGYGLTGYFGDPSMINFSVPLSIGIDILGKEGGIFLDTRASVRLFLTGAVLPEASVSLGLSF